MINASHPSDYVWQNLDKNSAEERKKYFFWETLVLIFMVFLLGPTSIVAVFESTLSDYLGSGAAIVALFLPAVIMFIFLEWVIPKVIEIFVKVERPSRESFQKNSEAEKYIKFFVCAEFIAVIVCQQLVGVIRKANSSSFTEDFARIVIGSGSLFVVFLAHMTFISNFVQLCGFSKYFVGLHNFQQAESKYDERLAWALRPFEISRHYAIATVVFFISMVYSVIMPIILPFSALFFFTKYYAHRSNLLTCFYVETNSNGLVSKTVLRSMLCGICVFWFFTGVICMMMEFDTYFSLGVAFCVIGITGIIFVLTFEEYVWKLGTSHINVEKNESELKKMRIYEKSELLLKCYVHPAERTMMHHSEKPGNHRRLVEISDLTSHK